MAIKVTKLTPHVGALVEGVDISQPLDAETKAAVNAAFDDHIALVFRDQDIDEQQQLAFAANFGPLGVRRRPPKEYGAAGETTRGHTMLVTNIRELGEARAGSYGDGEMWFHHDSCYYEVPNRATFLYSVEIPSRGGNTQVNSMYAAYDNLPADLRDRLEGKRVLQVHDYLRRERIDLDRIDLTQVLNRWQPIFVRHPSTGRRALYVNRLMSAAIEGMERAESEDVLHQLFEIVEDPAIVYEHEWQLGDLLMWDNFCSCHARTDFPAEERRLMRRCTIEGTPIEAAWAA
jgi:taurine dioxygenase